MGTDQRCIGVASSDEINRCGASVWNGDGELPTVHIDFPALDGHIGPRTEHVFQQWNELGFHAAEELARLILEAARQARDYHAERELAGVGVNADD
jgi:hypothetical protein